MLCCGNRKVNRIKPGEVFEPRPPSILKNKRYKRKSIYPKKDIIEKNKTKLEEKHKEREEFTDLFLSEVIECGACNELHSLRSGKLKINCASCNRFMCCNIAGACIGPDCSAMVDGEKQSLKYCMSCVNPYLKINIEGDGQCLCKSCELSPEIPNQYKRV